MKKNLRIHDQHQNPGAWAFNVQELPAELQENQSIKHLQPAAVWHRKDSCGQSQWLQVLGLVALRRPVLLKPHRVQLKRLGSAFLTWDSWVSLTRCLQSSMHSPQPQQMALFNSSTVQKGKSPQRVVLSAEQDHLTNPTPHLHNTLQKQSKTNNDRLHTSYFKQREN